MKILRGHIYTADLNPRFGTEPGKVRPVLIVQTDLMNAEHPSTLVCLLTSKTKSEVEILRVHLKKGEAGLNQVSDVMIDQIRAIDNRRFRREVGKLSHGKAKEVDEKLRIVLDLE